jgi:hypothetical protein
VVARTGRKTEPLGEAAPFGETQEPQPAIARMQARANGARTGRRVNLANAASAMPERTNNNDSRRKCAGERADGKGQALPDRQDKGGTLTGEET